MKCNILVPIFVIQLTFFYLILISQNVLAEESYSYDEVILEQLVKDVRLRKCNCKAEEVFVNGTCIEGDTFVPVLLLQELLVPFNVSTSKFKVLPNAGIQCTDSKTRAVLDPADFFILASGELLHVPTNVTFTPVDYCINHILDDEKTVTWELQLCLKPPEIPVCCKNKTLCNEISLPMMYGYSQIKEIFTKTKYSTVGKCQEGEVNSTATIYNGMGSYTMGYLKYEGESHQLVIWDSFPGMNSPIHLVEGQYCLSRELRRKGRIAMSVQFCVQDPLIEFNQSCANFTCVRKCCSEGAIFSQKMRECVIYDDHFMWKPSFHHKNGTLKEEEPENLKFIYGAPICKKNFYALDPTKEEVNNFLLSNGSIYFSQMNFSVPPDRYCTDNFLSLDGHITATTLTCFPDEKKFACKEAKLIIVPILLVASCVFLLITLVVYISIPELHAKLHGKSLLSHVTALFVAYLSLAIFQWYSETFSIAIRKGFVSVIQISFLGAFFWLNVMCFDIWWTLRSMRPVAETSESSRRRFVYYSIYAWGCAFIIGMVTLGMDKIPDTSEYASLVLPGLAIGHPDFFFKSQAAMIAYFYGFVFLLNLINIFFFVCVAIILIQAQRANNSILKTTNKQQKERVWIYLKLFVVMGITWVCEVVSWKEGTCEYWFVTDLINSLQGFFIFLIFICKKNIFTKLRTRGTASTRKIRRMVQGTSSYGSSTQVTQQTSLDSSRKLSTSIYYHLSKLNRDHVNDEQMKRY